MSNTFAAIDNARRVRRTEDAKEHNRLYPTHWITWRQGEPFYCAGDHELTDPHDWQPVPEYGRPYA
jgi:hypothetical protein